APVRLDGGPRVALDGQAGVPAAQDRCVLDHASALATTIANGSGGTPNRAAGFRPAGPARRGNDRPRPPLQSSEPRPTKKALQPAAPLQNVPSGCCVLV